MEQMISSNKDELFYSDLVYEIKRIAGLLDCEDEEVNQRIVIRMQMSESIGEPIRCFDPSCFEIELFSFVSEISRLVGCKFSSLDRIAEYPDVVLEQLKKYEVLNDKESVGKVRVLK